jgi:2-polyprenyl-3-methyl-5-hydroxy-6-metoxy-1,4-benzoquinol methylase
VSTSAEDTFTKQLVDIDRSPRRQLITADAIARHVNKLRTHLVMDATEEVVATLRTDRIQEGLALGWWQRLTFDGTPATTTSNRTRLNVSDPGWLNTLGGALTIEEGFILRPLPKWLYLKPLIPDLSGKSVLEIGCNNGFFSFAFRDAGARHVTGVEVHGPFVEAARWMARYAESATLNFGRETRCWT